LSRRGVEGKGKESKETMMTVYNASGLQYICRSVIRSRAARIRTERKGIHGRQSDHGKRSGAPCSVLIVIEFDV
jgi:hypothetical protein